VSEDVGFRGLLALGLLLLLDDLVADDGVDVRQEVKQDLDVVREEGLLVGAQDLMTRLAKPHYLRLTQNR
jgi:hypothetical protein